jgi:hypothetical protein
MQNRKPFIWREWKRAHRLLIAMLFCLTFIAIRVQGINTDTLDWQQHPYAVLIGTATAPIVVALVVYWWLGRGKKNSVKPN